MAKNFSLYSSLETRSRCILVKMFVKLIVFSQIYGLFSKLEVRKFLSSRKRTYKLENQWRCYVVAARFGCHHFGVTPFYDTNRTIKKTKICLILSSEMFSALEWTKK